jgi:hypothetical protein
VLTLIGELRGAFNYICTLHPPILSPTEKHRQGRPRNFLTLYHEASMFLISLFRLSAPAQQRP